MLNVATSQIRFVGVKKLNAPDSASAKEISEHYFALVKRELNQNVQLTVHIAVREPQGRQKFSIRLHVAAPAYVFRVDRHHGYVLSQTLRSAFDALMKEIEHKKQKVENRK